MADYYINKVPFQLTNNTFFFIKAVEEGKGLS